jgi:hypothetical protein
MKMIARACLIAVLSLFAILLVITDQIAAADPPSEVESVNLIDW